MENTDFISLEEAENIVSNLDIRDVVQNTYDEFSGSTFHDSICFLDLKTGKVFYRQMGKNESFQDSNRFFAIYSIDDQDIVNLENDDLYSSEDIPDGVDPDDFDPEDLDDYDERVVDALIWYARDARSETIIDRALENLRERYDKLERYNY